MAKQSVTLEEFLDLAGHELRIPITVLKGQVQLLRRRWGRQPGHERDVADLDRLLFQVERLNSMVQVMLDAFHASEGPLQLFPAESDYDLEEVVRHAVASAAVASSDYRLQLTVPDDDTPMVGNWDRVRIETVLSVLLSNAVKYNPPSEIQVRLAREGTMARIEVSDTGIGIPARDRARIFRPYTHASNAQNPGAGLGLYVAREIVRAHGGEMGLIPRKGGGSTFWFTLPLTHYLTLGDQVAAAAGMEGEPAASLPAPTERAPEPASGGRKPRPADPSPSGPDRHRAPARKATPPAERGAEPR